MVSAYTMNYTAEAIGLTRAAVEEAIPVVISFTTETDGKLPSGESLKEALLKVEEITDSAPLYYMVNCAHPSHFSAALEGGAEWVRRIRAVRSNASAKSHTELDDSTELDSGDLGEFERGYWELGKKLPNLAVVGGCCGTDECHIEAACAALLL